MHVALGISYPYLAFYPSAQGKAAPVSRTVFRSSVTHVPGTDPVLGTPTACSLEAQGKPAWRAPPWVRRAQ